MLNGTRYPDCGHGAAAQVEALGCAACLSNQRDEMMVALKAMLDAQSARRHPLGAPDEGIATLCVEAASKARAAIAKAEGKCRRCAHADHPDTVCHNRGTDVEDPTPCGCLGYEQVGDD